MGGVILLTTFSTEAQSLRYTLEYDAVTQTQFVVLDASELANWFPHHYVDVTPYRTETHVKKTVNTDDDLTTSTFVVSDSRHENWMTVAKLTTIDDKGIVMLDADENVLSEMPHSTQTQAAYEQNKRFLATYRLIDFPDFRTRPASFDLLDSLGCQVTDGLDGTTSAVCGDSVEYRYNANELWTEQHIKLQGASRYIIRNSFFYDSTDNRTKPREDIETIYMSLPNKTCAKRVTTTTYSRVVVMDQEFGQNLRAANPDGLTAAPTFATSYIEVTIPTLTEQGVLSIYNTLGTPVRSQTVQSGEKLMLNVEGLPEGAYMLTLTHKGRASTIRFAKL